MTNAQAIKSYKKDLEVYRQNSILKVITSDMILKN